LELVRLGVVRGAMPLLHVDDPPMRRDAMIVLRDVCFVRALRFSVR
jgi:hypothetical protein